MPRTDSLAAARAALDMAHCALEDARDRYEDAGWRHLQAPTERTARDVSYAATLYRGATESVAQADVRVTDAEAVARLDAAMADARLVSYRLAA